MTEEDEDRKILPSLSRRKGAYIMFGGIGGMLIVFAVLALSEVGK